MILLSHPRSGSEWFLSGLTDIKYSTWEIFGRLNTIPGTREYVFRNISVEAKISMLKHAMPNRADKIHFDNIDYQMNLPTWNKLYEVLKTKELYSLRRRDERATILSFLIAWYNDYNFHGSTANLIKKFKVNKTDFLKFYDLIIVKPKKLKNLFEFKEEFIYEDLVEGKQIPKTLNWNPSKSSIRKRGSEDYYNLIANYDEICSWIDEINSFPS